MSLSRKFIIVLVSSIFIVAIVNIVVFYLLYTSFLKIYLSEKIETKRVLTIEYINEIIKKQTEEEIDNIFSDSEIEFFELLETNSGQIPLNEKKNREIVIDYLIKSWLSPKYIEELIPSDNLSKIINDIKNRESAEYKFVSRLTSGVIIANLLTILTLSIFIWYFTKKTILPIKEVTKKIKELKPGRKDSIIKYEKKDEVGLLISSINWLNKRLNVQKSIRGRLLADISHELKTPITSIWCYLEWIIDWVIKLNKKNLKAITDEMNRLISLVNRIMNYERFENQKLDLELNNYNIYDLVKQIVEPHKKWLKENNQAVKIIWDQEKRIKLDKNLFNQVMHNIISNFWKYSWKNTVLKVSIEDKYIDFADNWAWVNQSEIPYLTERFYQANKEKSWDIEKRWIWVGLSLVDKIIEKHWWHYEIKSDIWEWFSFRIYF